MVSRDGREVVVVAGANDDDDDDSGGCGGGGAFDELAFDEGMSAGAIMEEDEAGNGTLDRSSMSGSESDSSSTRACDIVSRREEVYLVCHPSVGVHPSECCPSSADIKASMQLECQA